MGLTDTDMAAGSIFQTKYITWNNFGLEKNTKDLTTYQLMSYILEQVGIHEGTMVSYHQANDYNVTDEYVAGMELLQYDILYGDRYAYNCEDKYPASDLVMGVEDIYLNATLPKGKHLYDLGANFTPWSKVFINGEKVYTSFISSSQLKISTEHLAEGDNTLVVNQMGSSNTIFRSSNEVTYYNYIAQNLSE